VLFRSTIDALVEEGARLGLSLSVDDFRDG
jgi:hypothetical protein